MAKEKQKKEIKVSHSSEFDKEYSELVEVVSAEKKKGVENSFNNQLLKAIGRKIDLLKIQPDCGIHVPKNRIPKGFIIKYEINNLWKVNLPGDWRLCYTLNTGRLEILAILLEYMDHDRYNKLFGYKKK
ncbi:MAG: hypothetical protein ABH854_00265 [Candidatus Diapherotrites archaeon]|nr:hypothetical protein [Candidatus Micrarchaeota archaeon]